jgi:dimeric dUTPase (all-alpha-NTP-PPase superfamily)
MAYTGHVVEVTLDPRLTHMLEMQRTLQRMYDKNGLTPIELEGEDRMSYIRTQAYSLCDEIHEATNETGWKPWATSNHVNDDAFKSELVDAWHFFMNLMLVVDMTAEELYQGYVKKNAKNIQRQAEGYDGVTTKCPGCKRAYDDTAVQCKPSSELPPGVLAWCSKRQQHQSADWTTPPQCSGCGGWYEKKGTKCHPAVGGYVGAWCETEGALS